MTTCRFDDAEGKYYLFAGEGDTTEGPETNGTYVYLEVDDWKRWEEKLMFGPYIHHLGCAYGSYKPVLREVARYLRSYLMMRMSGKLIACKGDGITKSI